MKNDVKRAAKDAAKKAGKLWAAKKGLQMTGGLLKVGLIIGAGYFAYKFIMENREEIKDRLNME